MNDTTINLLKETLNSQPGNWQIRTHIAELYTADYNYSEAEEILNQESQLPEEESLLLKIANVYSHSNKDKALIILDQIIISNKACAPAYRIKASIYRDRGMETRSEKKLQCSSRN